tara:strand:- start:8 stop:367 length:360 start_codon:yes stop_codon:yes gene_type:complete
MTASGGELAATNANKKSKPGRESPADAPPHDWATGLVDRFVEGVENIRRITTQPVLTMARGLVYGILVLACVSAALILAGIGLFRLLDVVVPGESWSAHLILGIAFCTLGGLLWSRRSD